MEFVKEKRSRSERKAARVAASRSTRLSFHSRSLSGNLLSALIFVVSGMFLGQESIIFKGAAITAAASFD